MPIATFTIVVTYSLVDKQFNLFDLIYRTISYELRT